MWHRVIIACLCFLVFNATAFQPVSQKRVQVRFSHLSQGYQSDQVLPNTLNSSSSSDLGVEQQILDLKLRLFSISASCDRGFGASVRDRDVVLEIISSLREFSMENPTRGLYPNTDLSTPIEGVWKMVYTSALDVLSLAVNPVSQLQGIYQVRIQIFYFEIDID